MQVFLWVYWVHVSYYLTIFQFLACRPASNSKKQWKLINVAAAQHAQKYVYNVYSARNLAIPLIRWSYHGSRLYRYIFATGLDLRFAFCGSLQSRNNEVTLYFTIVHVSRTDAVKVAEETRLRLTRLATLSDRRCALFLKFNGFRFKFYKDWSYL